MKGNLVDVNIDHGSLVYMALVRSYPKSLTENEICDHIKAHFENWTPIRLIPKIALKYLSNENANITRVIKSRNIEFALDPKRIDPMDLKAQLRSLIIHLERTLIELIKILEDSNVPLSIQTILRKVKNNYSESVSRDDLYLLLLGTLKGHYRKIQSSSTYRLNRNAITSKFIESVKNELENYWDISNDSKRVLDENFNHESHKNIADFSRSQLRWLWFDNILDKVEANMTFGDNDYKENESKVSQPELDTNHNNHQLSDDLSVKVSKINIAFNDYAKTLNDLRSNRNISDSKKREDFVKFKQKQNELVEELASLFLESKNEIYNFSQSLNKLLFKDALNYLEDVVTDVNQEEQKISSYASLSSVEKELPEQKASSLYSFSPYSLLYQDIPSFDEFKKNIDDFEPRIIEIAADKDLDMNKIRRSLLICNSDFALDSDWEELYDCYTSDIDLSSLKFNSTGEELMLYASDATSSFIYILESVSDQITFKDKPRFKSLLDEVCRDNKIEPEEREYILEKAEEYKVPTDQVELYINRSFKNYPSFIPLINEICEDGVVDDYEKKFIYAQGKLYNIPSEIIDSLLAAGLFKVNRLNLFRNDHHFQNIMIMLILSEVLNLKDSFIHSVVNFVRKISQKELDENEAIDFTREFEALKRADFTHLLGKKLNIDLLSESNDIDRTLERIGVKREMFCFNSSEKFEENNHHDSVQEENYIHFNNYSFKTVLIQNATLDLFTYAFDHSTGEHIIRLNARHSAYNKNAKNELFKLGASIYCAKLSMSNTEITEKFINRFQQNLKLV